MGAREFAKTRALLLLTTRGKKELKSSRIMMDETQTDENIVEIKVSKDLNLISTNSQSKE